MGNHGSTLSKDAEEFAKQLQSQFSERQQQILLTMIEKISAFEHDTAMSSTPALNAPGNKLPYTYLLVENIDKFFSTTVNVPPRLSKAIANYFILASAALVHASNKNTQKDTQKDKKSRPRPKSQLNTGKIKLTHFLSGIYNFLHDDTNYKPLLFQAYAQEHDVARDFITDVASVALGYYDASSRPNSKREETLKWWTPSEKFVQFVLKTPQGSLLSGSHANLAPKKYDLSFLDDHKEQEEPIRETKRDKKKPTSRKEENESAPLQKKIFAKNSLLGHMDDLVPNTYLNKLLVTIWTHLFLDPLNLTIPATTPRKSGDIPRKGSESPALSKSTDTIASQRRPTSPLARPTSPLANPLDLEESRLKALRQQCLKRPRLAGPKSRILNLEDFWLFDVSLSPEFRNLSWQCIYSSASMGRSWTNFHSAIMDRGSTVIVLKDKDGYIFGGFASTEWIPQPKFYGDSRCFLFTLSPKIEFFHPSGFNNNFQYFNFSNKTVANGLALGGQTDYWAFYIDPGFDKGCSQANPLNTTYGSPRLSKEEQFTFVELEVWLVKEKERDERLIETPKKPGGHHNAEAQALLEMAGKVLYAKAIGERDGGVDDEEEEDD